VEQRDEKVNTERESDGEAEEGFNHDGLLQPLGRGGVEDHGCEEREPKAQIEEVQHGRLPLKRSKTRPRAPDIKDRLEMRPLIIRGA
jgi:hypothetical protein